MKRFTPTDMQVLLAMHADWAEGVLTIDPDDIEGQDALHVLACALAVSVPLLVAEVCRLQVEREDGGRPRISTWAKMDGQHGGSA